MYQIYLANVERFYDEQVLGEVMISLRAMDKDKVNSYKNNGDKARSLVSLLLREYVFEKVLDVKNPSIRIADGGKPYLEDYSNFFFNISHSGSYVVCVIGNQEVGVDIQLHKKVSEGFGKRFFCREEMAYLETVAEESEITKVDMIEVDMTESGTTEDSKEAEKRFFSIWTKKESYVKYLGTGMKEDFRKINVLSNSNVNFVEYDDIQGYSITVCLKNPEQRVQMIPVDL